MNTFIKNIPLRIKHNVYVSLILACLLSMSTQALQSSKDYQTVTRYNKAGQITGTFSADPDGPGPLERIVTRNTYNTKGQLIKTDYGNLNIWAFENSDPNGWNMDIKSSVVYTYDSLGRVRAEKTLDQIGDDVSLVQYSYDAKDRVICKAQRMNISAYSSLPSSACTLGSSGSYGRDRITRYEYTYAGDVHTEWRAWGASLQQKYVTRTFKPYTRLVETVKDANGNVTKLNYDDYARITKRTYPSKTTAGQLNSNDYNEYRYDRRGNMTWELKRNKAVFTYVYDKNNRLIKKDQSGTSKDVYYRYDLRGLTLHSRFGSHSGQGIINTFDGFGRLSETTSSMGGANRKLSYNYDQNSNRTRIYHTDGRYFSYRFDQLNRITGLGESTSTTNVLSVNYNNNGKRQNIQRYGGADTNYYYDNAQRFYRFNQNFSGSSNDLTNTFQFNPAGQITQLTVSNDIYHYFGNDNHTGGYHVNGLNQYTNINGKSLNYDNNGNLSTYNGYSYNYDNENKLISVIKPTENVSLQYDPLGRLYKVTGRSGSRYFLYDGDALVAEYSSRTTNTPYRRYLHGDQVDEPLVQYNGSLIGAGYRQYLHNDHLGSIIAHSTSSNSSSNNVTKRITYDTYGITSNDKPDRFGYTGQIWLEDIGLYYYKARMYSPYLGRFLQTDPIFYADQMNMYAYVGNDPVNAKDPTGKACQRYMDGSISCDGPLENPWTFDDSGTSTPPKVQGNPQASKNTPTHGSTIQRVANEAAQAKGVKSVHMHQRLTTVLPKNPGATGQLPDVTVVHKNGNVDFVEVPSKGQTPASQISKMNKMRTSINVPGRNIIVQPDIAGVAPTRPYGIPTTSTVNSVLLPLSIMQIMFNSYVNHRVEQNNANQCIPPACM